MSYHVPFRARLGLLVCLLALGSASQAAVTINEFLANNGGGLPDEDLQSPGWIEIYNSGPGAVNLGGWRLTDDAGNLAKWTFPATNLPAGGYQVVFASGKNRANLGWPLHTNFQLDKGGEYLALVQPGGTVAHAYSPAFPNQRQNVSYGLEVQTVATSLISSGATARVFVPGDGTLGTTWTAAVFNDAAWTAGNTPASFVVGVTTNVVLSLDVNDRSNQAGFTAAGFSAFLINSNVSSTAIQTQATVRVISGITVTVSNTAPYGYDDRLRPAPTDSGAFTESLLLQDFLYSLDSTGTGGLDISLAGLTANSSHRLTVWSFDGQSSGNKVSDWSVNGVVFANNYTFNSATQPTANDQYRFVTTANTTGSGTLLLSGRRDATTATTGVYFNALKVERVTVSAATNALGTAMLSNNATAYVRIPFNVANPNAFQNLKLRMRSDDGFVAYVNGQVVALRNAPGSPQWNSSATTAAADSQSLVYEEIVFTNAPGLLLAGANVLAIHGLNVSATDTDFFILPELQGLSTGATVESYFTPPTPGTNNGAGYLGLVADTKFSVDRGFYDTPFTVAITSATATASIYWTTNGSRPSLTNGTLYTAPVSIPGTRLLRAAAFLTNYIPSEPDTHSYIFIGQVLTQSSNQPGYPTTWQATYPADYGIDPFIVNHPTYGATISNSFRAIPTLSLVSSHEEFWSSTIGIYPDATLEREVSTSAELFNGDNTSEFQINCAILMHGQAGRDNVRSAKHSMRLEFKSAYGASQLSHNWFGGGVSDFNAIILRSSWADSWATRYDPFSGGSFPWAADFPLRYRPDYACYLRDAWVREAMLNMGHVASRNQQVHLYLNGLYWGVYNPIERLDTSFFANNLGGYEKDWDIVKDRAGNGTAELQDGIEADWTNLIAQVNSGIPNEAAYQAIAAQVDIDNLIDYMLLHGLVEANDWLQDSNPHNWFGAHRRANATNGLPATKWIFLPWDQEISMNRVRNDDRVNVSANHMPSRIYSQLRANWPEFRRIYGDRAHKQLFNDGALTPSNNIARMQGLAAQIGQAMVAESARWGDARKFNIPYPGGTNFGTGLTLTPDNAWVPELQQLYTNWYPNVMNQRLLARLIAAGLYPSNSAPVFSQFGGAVTNGFALGITHTNASGLIYFTTDGSDPRVYGTGAIAGTAQSYAATIPINAPTVVRARVYNSGNWSALTEATFYPPQDLSKLALTEIMYNPPAIGATTGNNLEFIELKNTGTNTLNLSGLTFTSGITFTFTNGTTLAPGQFFVLARNAAAFASKYPGVTVHGTYTGQLDNAGESLTLSHALGTPIFSVTYDDRPEWPVTPDVANFSLVQTQPGVSQAPDRGNRWRASTNPGGSPGADDPAPSIAPIVINEVLAHTDLPQKDAIELFNPTGTNVNIGGWYLTDEPDTPQKFRIPNNTIINAGARIYFDEDDFNAFPGTPTNFLLSSTGDDVHLFSANTNGTLTGYSHSAEFGASFNGTSFGRHVNSASDEFFPRQTSVTLGSANSGPVIGPVVISEIHYNPETNGFEFLELLNITASPVQLFSAAFPTNAWKLSGVDFTFPTNLTLTANSTLLVVATNAATFRAHYNVPTNILILGPFAGQLQDNGENVELQAPDNPNTNGVPYVTMDAVRYNDKSPWPPAADGSGMSLQRSPTTGYGNEPTNWIAAAPTPGQAVGASDSDSDGLPDAWEDEFGTLKFIADASADPDLDGMTNMEEYLAGTHPNNASSALKFQQITASGGNVILQFLASSNRTYTLLFKPTLNAAQWSKLTDISAHPTNRVVTLTNTVPGDSQRFYRLVTPAQPEGFMGILRVESTSVNAGIVSLGFGATSNRSYSVQYKSSIGDTAWLRLKDLAAQPTNRTAIVTDNPQGAARRFYRVVSPAQL